MGVQTSGRLELLAFYARANRVVNGRLLEVLAADHTLLHRPLNGYFRDIGAILGHSYVADGMWVADIAFSAQLALRHAIDTAAVPQYETFRFEDFAQLRTLRAAKDDVIQELVGQLTEESLFASVMDYENQKHGVNQPVWKSLLHLFNHQTHHRGQVSQALELFGVKHDYSNLINID